MTKSQIPTRPRPLGVERGRVRRIGVWGLGFGIFLVLFASACAKARAETVPDGPPLQVPAPPQRVLAPVEEPPAAASVPEPEAPPPAVATPRTPARPAAAPRPRPVPPAGAQAPPPQTPPDTRELRAPSSTSAVTERSVRETLARASRDIGRVNYTRLSAEGRANYDESRRFSAQAEQALKERNLMFAATLADKAATLAAELVGR